MKDEINNYNITNPDGVPQDNLDSEKKISFYNDKANSVAEDFSAEVNEWDYSVAEDFGTAEKTRSDRSYGNGGTGSQDEYNTDSTGGDVANTSSASSASSASSVSTAASSTAASAASAVGGSIGAVAGAVATSVVAAIIVVVAFVSTMTINATLAIAEMTRLVFQVQIERAQEEDFAKPIYATLEGNGYYLEQEIYSDTVYLAYEDLEPAKEYVLKIFNEEKVFFEKSYITASKEVYRGSMEIALERDRAIVYVQDVLLKSGEYYTLTVKDAGGKVVFVKDSVNVNAEYTFPLSDYTDLYITLSVGGSVYAVEEIRISKEPEYDFDNPVWEWDGYESATLVFREIYGREPLEIKAEIAASYNHPSCETDGEYIYVATALYGDEIYSDEQIITEYNSALGHDYGEPQFAWEHDESGYTAVAIFTCSHDGSHTFTLPAMVSQDGDTFYAEVEYDREPYSGELPAEYDFDNPVWTWGEDFSTATLSFAEIHGGEPLELTADVIQGNYEFTAYVEYNGQSYNDTYYLENPEEPEPQGGVVISIEDGAICIDPNGYARSESELSSNPTAFVSSAASPYLIENQNVDWCDNIIQVYQKDSNLAISDIYIKLNNVRIEAGSWCSLFLIKATQTVNIHLIIEGTVTFVGGSGQQIFSSQGSGAPTVNIIIDKTSAGGTFNAEISDGLTYAASGTINVSYQ